MNRRDIEKCWQMAISNIQYGQDYAARLKDLVPESELEAALAKIDSAILDLEGLRDGWRKKIPA